MPIAPSTRQNNSAAASGGTSSLKVKTTDYQVVNGDSGCVFSNSGASGQVILTLPPALVSDPVKEFSFVVKESFNFRIKAGGTDVINDTTDGGYVENSNIDECIVLICVEDGVWTVYTYSGTWIYSTS